MGNIGHSFSSYTFTDISTGFFETAQDVFASAGDKMIFKSLDIEKDVTAQGYEEHSYDLVVASLVLHATTDLHRTLTNTGRLLKPGGYLILQEVSNNDVTRVGFLMCALPGWWLGQNDGRKLSPCVSTLEWHRLLLQSGFSGIDSSTPEYDATPFPLAIIVSQAVDDRISLLREPLSMFGLQAAVEGEWDLVLVGGQSLTTILLIEQIIGLVQPSGIKCTVFKTLADIDTAKISAKSIILCIAELNEPVFKRLSERTLDGMKRLFETQKTILWITQGCRSEDPHMNMAVGLGRSLVLENPDLVLQFLDLESGVKPNPRQLLEALLRLRQGDILEKEGNFDNMLWTNEHELAYENGDLTISRVHHKDALNDRYNASKRTIFETVDPQTVPVNLAKDTLSRHTLVLDNSLAAEMLDPQAMTAGSNIFVKVSHSFSTPALVTPLHPSYLVYGINKATKRSVIAVSPSNGSCALLPPQRVLDIELPVGKELDFINHLYIQMLVENVLSLCQRGSTILIHEPSPELASSIAESASDENISVVFTTSSSGPAEKAWTRMNSYAPERVIQSSIPSQVSAFIDCSTSGQKGRAGLLIASCLPLSCIRTTIAEFQNLRLARSFSTADLRQIFSNLVQRALKETLKSKQSSTLPVIGLEQVIGRSNNDANVPAIVDWRVPARFPVQITTVDSKVTFKGNRIYVLFGLTSDLAQSICDWMVSHGARNIILTSRTPKIDTKWIELLAEAGVRLEFFAK